MTNPHSTNCLEECYLLCVSTRVKLMFSDEKTKKWHNNVGFYSVIPFVLYNNPSLNGWPAAPVQIFATMSLKLFKHLKLVARSAGKPLTFFKQIGLKCYLTTGDYLDLCKAVSRVNMMEKNLKHMS